MIRRCLALVLLALAGCGAPAPVAGHFVLRHSYTTREPQFQRAMDHLIGPPSVAGNSVSVLADAPQIYPALLETIRSAQQSITLETYILWSDDIGEQFASALAERARAGVKTHLIVDALGSDRLSGHHVQMMEDAGVRVVRYNPIEKIVLLFTAGQVNQRTHRKLLVIDGKIGFIGGAGIAELWLGAESKAKTSEAEASHRQSLGNDGDLTWRDYFYRVEGPVVAQLQSAFMENWLEAAGEPLDGKAYFPELEHSGDVRAQVVVSSARDGSARMELMYLLAINAAAESIYIATPYFVPNDLLIQSLIAASQRGVKITIITPGERIDHPMVRQASHARWNELLDAGIEFYEYLPAMYHAKVMIVDGVWTSVGSSNLDPRSLRLSDEANLNVFDAPFAARHLQLLEEDLANSRKITHFDYQKRSLFKRVGEFFASMFSPQL